MGINAGIKVIRRITDEQRWLKFLQAVVEYFKNDASVGMEVKINLNTCDVENNTESSLKTSILSKNEIQLFHLTEIFNFVPNDWSLSGLWHTQLQTPLYELYGTSNDKEQVKLKEATTVKLQSEVIRLNYTDVDIEQLISTKFLHPKQAIVFHVGEAPDLPIYAHHFKAIESKLTSGGYKADIVLRGISKLLDQYFPGHTRYWSEFEEHKGFPDGDRISYETRDETDQFYRMLIESASQSDKAHPHPQDI